MIVGTVACYKAVRGSCLTMWIMVFFTWTILFDLVLSSSQYCFSTHGNLINEGTKVKRKIKHGLRITIKELRLSPLKKKKSCDSLKNFRLGKILEVIFLISWFYRWGNWGLLLINSLIYSEIWQMDIALIQALVNKRDHVYDPLSLYSSGETVKTDK